MQPLPQRIGKYEVRGKLGEGRMGVVYLAYDTVLEREVALKVMATSIESNEELRHRGCKQRGKGSAVVPRRHDVLECSRWRL